MANIMDRLERRNQLIGLRVESMERRKLLLQSHEKWPTIKAVRRYQGRKSSSPPASQLPPSPAASLPLSQSTDEESASHKCKETNSFPPELSALPFPVPLASQPSDQNDGERSSSPKVKNIKTTTPEFVPFPFPISLGKKIKTFPQFPSLPPEIRIQIWELALLVPRFIEAQFCMQFYQPAFVNYVDRSVLVSVCHESRAIALASAPDIKSLKALAFRPHPLYRNRFWGLGAVDRRKNEPKPNRTLHFSPERDTVFFRSLDFPPSNFGYFMRQVIGMGSIQHLAIPLELWNGIPSKEEWHGIVMALPELKTVTFMVGSKEKSYRGTQRSIELRDVEQWFVDGRSRDIHKGDGGTIDVDDVGSYLKNQVPFTSYTSSSNGGHRRLIGRPGSRVVNVRVVAWKRGGRT